MQIKNIVNILYPLLFGIIIGPILWKQSYFPSILNRVVGSSQYSTPVSPGKDYSVCRIRTTVLKVTAHSLCGSGTVELQVTEYSVCGSGTSSHRIFCVWNISGSLCNDPNYTSAQGPQALGSKPSWRCCYLLFHLGGGSYWDFLCVFSDIIKQ